MSTSEAVGEGFAQTPYLRDAEHVMLGSRIPKPTSTSKEQMESLLDLWTSNDSCADVGVWEADPGTFTATREGYHEICLFLAGRTTVTEDGGTPIDLQAGDVFITPAGWTGTWQVHETLRKVFVIVKVPPTL